MPYSHITHTRCGREALNYVLNGEGHDGSDQRNLYVGSVGFLPDDAAPYIDQCEKLWAHASSRNKTRMRRMIVSFSENELPHTQRITPNIFTMKGVLSFSALT